MSTSTSLSTSDGLTSVDPVRRFSLDTEAGTCSADTGMSGDPPAAKRQRHCAKQTLDASPSNSSPSRAEPQYRSFFESEIEEAWRKSNYFVATPGLTDPVALWIVGPSAVGKSTLAPIVSENFGIPKVGSSRLKPTENSISTASSIREGLLSSEGDENIPDAVVVDGAFFRDCHGAYQQSGCSHEWKDASKKSLKSQVSEEKNKMMKQAVEARKNLIIPQTCLSLQKNILEVEDLTRKGYLNHVLAVTGSLEDVQRRGHQRAIESGKSYNSDTYEQSTAAMQPMMSAVNGRYQVVRALELDDTQELPVHRTENKNGAGTARAGFARQRSMTYEVLASGSTSPPPDLIAKLRAK